MARLLYPPTFIAVPIELLVARDENGERLPSGALETWLDMRALAWGHNASRRMDFLTLQQLTGKTRSTLCGHLALLTHWFGLRWSISGKRLQVFFSGDEEGGRPAAAAAADTAAPGAAEVGAAAPPAEAGAPPAAEASPAPAEASLAPAESSPAPAESSPAPAESENQDSLNTQILKDAELQFKEREAGVQKSGLGRRGRDSRGRDPRTNHPAIAACRVVGSRYPDRSIYDRLIAALGETPNMDRLWECRREWLERGYNPASWKWAVEWYVAGIPEQGPKKGEQRHASRNSGGGSSEVEAAPSALAQRLSGKG